MDTVHVYGMRNHGYSPGAQPEEGFAGVEADPLDEYWNILVYNRRLEDKECKDYDLDRLGQRYIE